ncbi:hypothetical protein FNF27_01927 [Cafeteria roenbergensis]|uniref:phosphoribosylaminoimidazole carboxylase n=1 Tax=Cafeteria roenbergensis TaxID=33653 RepID=A0A5A8EFL7_CAFRO|nr:hypothetical protein FNF27_01927 [Cafeteria roenbergensis]
MAASKPPTTAKVWRSVGVLGGGQLGRMMAEAAHRLGARVVVLDPTEGCPAAQVCHAQVVGDFRDKASVLELARQVDVLTCEIEHVNAAAMAEASAVTTVEPSAETMAVVQDKFAQKQHFADAGGVSLGEFREVSSEADIAAAGVEWGWPLMLKARRMAYDGKGNAVVPSAEQVPAAAAALGGAGPGALYVEKWVPFERELAVMVVRGRDGEVRSYDCVETVQRDSVCHVVIAPARVDGVLREQARRVAEAAVATLPGAGIYGVELFLTQRASAGEPQRVLLNEVAPRPHNSGHFTIEACECDQFENHLRAVMGLPLGSTAMRVGAAVMVNALGTGSGDADLEATWGPLARGLSTPGAALHWYGKAGVRLGRKVGHVTVTGSSPMEAAARAEAVLGEPLPGAAAGAGGAAGGAASAAMGGPGPLVGVIMGSDSDLPTMRAAAEVLRSFGVPFEVSIVSAHRTPDRMMQYARQARARGLRVIIAAAGGAAHLPGMVAAMTPLPVIGVPVPLKHLDGVDSLHSIVQMPRGVPCATVAIGNSTNAALLAVRMLSVAMPHLADAMEAYQADMERTVMEKVERLESTGWEAYGRSD